MKKNFMIWGTKMIIFTQKKYSWEKGKEITKAVKSVAEDTNVLVANFHTFFFFCISLFVHSFIFASIFLMHQHIVLPILVEYPSNLLNSICTFFIVFYCCGFHGYQTASPHHRLGYYKIIYFLSSF